MNASDVVKITQETRANNKKFQSRLLYCLKEIEEAARNGYATYTLNCEYGPSDGQAEYIVAELTARGFQAYVSTAQGRHGLYTRVNVQWGV